MTTEAPRAGTDPDHETDPDEDYLSRLLQLHPECDPEVGEPGTVPALVPATVAAATPTSPVGVNGPSSPTIAYDRDGWIAVVPDEPVPEPAPAPPAANVPPPELPAMAAPDAEPSPRRWRRNVPYVAVVLIIALVVAGMALAPGGERPVLLSGVPTTEAVGGTDPLSEEWRLDKLNLQFSDVEEGYVQVFDGSIDPVGTDGCTQPGKKDGVVATSRAAYAYRPDHLDGFAAGHVASMVTVFKTEEQAAARAQHERQPEYLTCLSAWDETTWFGGTSMEPQSQSILAVPASLGGRTLVGARYTSTYDAPDGRTYPAYTDHIIVTTGRVRVWIELSSVLYPFDPERRDTIVDGILERIDDALT